MKQFTDGAGRSWTISLTIDAVKRVRGLLSINLLDIESGNPPLFTRLATDLELCCDVIFALIKPQADAAGVTDTQFGASLGGEFIKSAQDAFAGELLDFFQKLGRQDLAKALGFQRKMIDGAVNQFTTRVENLDIETELKKILGPTSTPSPASSA